MFDRKLTALAPLLAAALLVLAASSARAATRERVAAPGRCGLPERLRSMRCAPVVWATLGVCTRKVLAGGCCKR